MLYSCHPSSSDLWGLSWHSSTPQHVHSNHKPSPPPQVAAHPHLQLRRLLEMVRIPSEPFDLGQGLGLMLRLSLRPGIELRLRLRLRLGGGGSA